jgi:tetratricopeptide (TPR) repeat protein
MADPTDNPDSTTPVVSDAGPTLEVAQQDEPVLVAQLRRTSELISAQRLPEAEAELVGAQQTSARDLRVLKLLALVRFKLGRLAESRQVYLEAAEVAPEDPSVRLNLGLIAIKLDAFEEAARELEAAVRLQPDDRRAWSYLGYAYARCDMKTQAASAFRRAGQHELAAEMERAVAPPAHVTDGAVVEGLDTPGPGESATMRALSSTDATPRPLRRSDQTPVPVRKSPAMEWSVGATLADFTTARLLTLEPSAEAIASIGPGILRFAAGAETHVRESALLVALGGPALALARRRRRGQLSQDKLSDKRDRFFRVDGAGDLILTSPDASRRLVALSLDHDILYLDEERVVAWGDEVVWESGCVPGEGKALLQFRGTGRVVLWTAEDEVVAVRIADNERMAVPSARLVGWLGRVVVQSNASGEIVPKGPHHVTCEGEGVLLLSRHGEHP